MSLNEVSLRIPTEHMANVFGQFDANIKKIERTLGVTVVVRDDQLKIIGTSSAASGAQEVFEQLYELAKRGNVISEQNVNYALALLQEHKGSEMVEMDKDVICHTIQGKPVKPKTLGQKDYVDNIRKKMIVFGMGPAGTGKTYLAMAMAIAALKRKEIGRIILTRPVVEAGENLGFLPGTLDEKIDPYVRPLYDALYDMTDMEKGNQLISQGVIEIAPLAFMRGRTFNDAFLILDEAQNTTPEQLKMFLTRLGFGSKMVITGDVTQVDLPTGSSGLKGVRDILGGIDEISFIDLTGADVVRHNLVARIVRAYDEAAHGVQQSIEGLE